MNKTFTVIANNMHDTTNQDDGIIDICNSYEDAVSCVKKDMERYQDSSYGINLNLDFDAMYAESTDHSFRREWNIIEN